MPPWAGKQLERAYLLALARFGVARNDTRIVGQIKAGIGCPSQNLFFHTTSPSNPIYMCFYLMASTSTARWSKRAGAGGIGSMRRGYGAGRVRDRNARGAERLVG
jgi:hypothetical protein